MKSPYNPAILLLGIYPEETKTEKDTCTTKFIAALFTIARTVLEKTLEMESLLDCKEIQPVQPKGDQLGVHWKDWCWSWNSNTLATSWEELTHWKRPWCWEWLGAGGEGTDRVIHGWMASLTRWTWVWVNSGSWWWTGRPGVLWSMGSQRVGHNWANELNRTELRTWKHLDVHRQMNG